MTRFRSISIFLAAAVLSVSVVACSSDEDASDDLGDDSGDGPTATAPVDQTETPTSTAPSGGDQPTSSDGTPIATPDETQAPSDGMDDIERVEELAPIEEIEVLMLESFPVQYRLDVTSGLPSGCAAFESIEVEQDGTTFNVTVLNTVPAPDQEIACTMIYGIHESTVDLGTGLESGTEYTVNVNDEATTFVAQ